MFATMITLNTNSTRTPRFSRRRRVSNQLAAFAAIMLFASTQVDSPGETDSGHPVNDMLAQELVYEHDSRADPAPESESGGITEAVLGSHTKARGLDFSLFLFRR